MTTSTRLIALVLAAAGSGLFLAGCASPAPVVAPVTRDVGTLQGATVDLVVGQVLNIDTGDLAVDSYRGEVADPEVATFVAGREEGGATYNPGVEALADGTTTVVLSNENGGIQDVTFTVEVSG
ncbi:hypothetical protein K0817_011025 [Microbacterium sp. HD4P20]|uniref:hypothetical protein n=1 Tax=Microbacterium sp. HD4P20 TaxID=2864874 RepID=UPI001C63E1B6|nr:hypothetical protein [Microbacterium sp. HD4P20]MCP2637089.1 hypothetical protein [Microbacterium sp. HD4P20]